MRIQKNQLICGYPAFEIRKLLRSWRQMEVGTATIERELGLTQPQAKLLLTSLISEGLVAEDGTLQGHDGHEVVYALTRPGAALAMAKASAPVARAVARKHLHELIERMRIVNEDPTFIVGIEQAVVFGSYLSNAERLGDLDISYTTYRRIDDQRTFVRASEEAARTSGRRFSTFIDMVAWPYEQVRLFLKNRSRVYSLAHDDGLLDDPSVSRVIIFENRKPVPNWREI